MFAGTDTVEQVVTKIMAVMDVHNKIRLNDMVEESERIERDRIRQEQALEWVVGKENREREFVL